MTAFDLDPGAHVELELGGHGRYEARAEGQDGDKLAIVVAGPLPVLASGLIGDRAAVIHATPRGLQRVEATVVAAGRGGRLELAALNEAQVAQRREHVRVAVALPATIRPIDRSRPALGTFTVDLSGSGVLLAGAGPVEPGDGLLVTLKLPGADEPVAAPSSRVVRADATGHVAVAFGGLGRTDRERIVRYVFERQREERRAARGER